MSKVLIITTTSGFLSQFELNNVKLLQERGYQVHYATNFGVPVYEVKDDTLRNMGVVLHHISIEKNPFKIKKNIWALRELTRIIEREQIDVIHCHNPNGGVLGRLAAAFSKRKPFVIYTAHGFHFFKGAPVKNWLFYYPVEKMLAKLSDIIITINHEDYNRAKRFRYKKHGSAELIPGVGVDLGLFEPIEAHNENREKSAVIREQWGIPRDAFHIVSAGELNENKNHIVVIKALAQLQNKNIYYSICGEGDRHDALDEEIQRNGLSDRVVLRGYRNDMPEIMKTADLSVFPSIREGMGMAALEAMASGIPLIVADNRGTREYITDHENGLVCQADSVREFAQAIQFMYENSQKRELFAKNALQSVQQFSLQQSEKRMRQIYARLPENKFVSVEYETVAPMISVIMGVYNQRDLTVFDKAVSSVLNQSYDNFECDGIGRADGGAFRLAWNLDEVADGTCV